MSKLVFLLFLALAPQMSFAKAGDERISMECLFYGIKGGTERVKFVVERKSGEFWTGSFSQQVRVAKADGSIVKVPAAYKVIGTQHQIPAFSDQMGSYKGQMTVLNPDVRQTEVYQSEVMGAHLYFERHLRNDRVRSLEERLMPHAQHQANSAKEPQTKRGIAFFCNPTGRIR